MSAHKGFTLIELLLVIAITGILAVVLATAINPLRRMNQANDSKVKSDIGQIASALQSYYTMNQTYPTTAQTLTQLTVTSDLTVVPAAPSGYSAYAYTGCATAPCTSSSVSGQLKAGTATNSLWCWRSAAGTAVDATVCAP